MNAVIFDFNDPDMIARIKARKAKEAQRDEERRGLDSEAIHEIELALVGSFINDSTLLDDFTGLKPIHFSDHVSRHIFNLIQRRHAKGQLTDAYIVESKIKGDAYLWDIEVDEKEFIRLYQKCALVSPIQVRAYVDLILEHNARIDLLSSLKEAGRKLDNPDYPSKDIVSELNTKFADIYSDSSSEVTGLKSIDETLSMPPLDWIVGDFLQEVSLSCIFAPSFSGKSYVALDMALNVAQGTDWHGRAVKPATVAYIAAEGARGMSVRANAWLAANQAQEGLPPFFFYTQPLDFFDAGHVNHFIKICLAKGVKFVVIDTLARCFGSRDENSTQDMSEFINAVDRLKREIAGHVMIIHHTGKDKDNGARGSSAFKAALDTEIEIKKDVGLPTLRVCITKQKDGGAELPFEKLEFFEKDCSHPTTGEVLTGSILRKFEQKGRAPNQRLGKNELTVMRCLAGGESGFGFIQVQTGMDKGNLSRTLKALIQKGLVIKDGEDYRKIKNV